MATEMRLEGCQETAQTVLCTGELGLTKLVQLGAGVKETDCDQCKSFLDAED